MSIWNMLKLHDNVRQHTSMYKYETVTAYGWLSIFLPINHDYWLKGLKLKAVLTLYTELIIQWGTHSCSMMEENCWQNWELHRRNCMEDIRITSVAGSKQNKTKTNLRRKRGP